MNNKSIINEKDVIGVVRDALMSKVAEVMNGYSSPLNGIVTRVISQHEEELSRIVREALALSLKDKQFVSDVNEQFKHKVAKVLVGKLEGAVEKAADRLRADPTLRARLIIAIEDLIK